MEISFPAPTPYCGGEGARSPQALPTRQLTSYVTGTGSQSLYLTRLLQPERLSVK